ncbi:MAG: DUF484 family protein [Gammaproteobacteria bacterium]|nr:DUF484 family protein [Gammaproteobacteria bacterium]
MSNETSAAENIPEATGSGVTAEQVAAFLGANPDFFLDHQELLADLTLPHQSGEAVSLLERQVSVLRERSLHVNTKLGNLLENASKNDQLFEVTRTLVLTLLGAETVEQLAVAVCGTLLRQESVDACKLLLNDSRHSDSTDNLTVDANLDTIFAEVFRLQHTHCGQPEQEQMEILFGAKASDIKSTALCPILANGTPLGILAIGSEQSNYFNVNLDTLFLDFIGHVIAAALEGKLSR